MIDDMGNPIMGEAVFFRLPKNWREIGYFKDGLPERKSAAARTDSNASTILRYSSSSWLIITCGQAQGIAIMTQTVCLHDQLLTSQSH